MNYTVGMSFDAAIRRIIAKAVHAPSGDNAQPWRFKLQDDILRVFVVRGRDATLYNFRERGSYVAHGALVENIALLAPLEGLQTAITPFPAEPDCTAVIMFDKNGGDIDPLAQYIGKRTTNRKPYELTFLGDSDAKALQEAARGRSAVLRLVREREAIRALAEDLSINERLLMENRELHDFLFSIIRWRKDDARPGLYVKTMEFPPPVRILMRFVIRNWRLTKALNRIGLSKKIPKESGAVYAASSALGAVVVGGDRDVDFFTAGRAFQRVWLSATGRGLSIQPLAAIPYLHQRVTAEDTRSLTEEHVELIKRSYGSIAKAFRLGKGELCAMLFRIGKGGMPSARSQKIPPVFA